MKEVTPKGNRGLCKNIMMDWSSCFGSLCVCWSERAQGRLRSNGRRALSVYIINVKQRSQVSYQYTTSMTLATHDDPIEFINCRYWVIEVPPQCRAVWPILNVDISAQ